MDNIIVNPQQSTPSSSVPVQTLPTPVATPPNVESANPNPTQPDTTSGIDYEDILKKDILVLLGEDKLPEDKKNELYKKMLETIQARALMNVLDLLPDDKQDEFSEMLDKEDATAVNQFLKENGVDMEKVMLEESLIYKAELVELQKSAKKTQ